MFGKRGTLSGWLSAARRMHERTNLNAVMLGIICAFGPVASCASFKEDIDRLVGQTVLESIHGNSEASNDTVTSPSDAAAPVTPSAKAEDHADGISRELNSIAAKTIGPSVDLQEAIFEVKQHLARLVRRGVITELYVDPLRANLTDTIDQFFVQIGSYQVLSAAEDQLNAAKSKFTTLLFGYEMRVRAADLVPRGRFYRVHIGPFESHGAAHGFCRRLQDKNQECITVAQPPPDTTHPPRRAGLEVEWASMPPVVARAGTPAGLEAMAPASNAAVVSQIADAMALFTAPGLAGVPE